jgi:hypothetical protein
MDLKDVADPSRRRISGDDSEKQTRRRRFAQKKTDGTKNAKILNKIK